MPLTTRALIVAGLALLACTHPLGAEAFEDFVTADLTVTVAPTAGAWTGVTIDNHAARGEIWTQFGFIGPSHSWTEAPPPYPVAATEEHTQSVGPVHELVRGQGSVTSGLPMQMNTHAEARVGSADESGVGHHIEFEGIGLAAFDLLYNGPSPTFEITITADCSYTVDFDSPEDDPLANVAWIGHTVALRRYQGSDLMENVLPTAGDFVYGGDDLHGPGVFFSRNTPQLPGEIEQAFNLTGQWTFDLLQGQRYAVVIDTLGSLYETLIPEPASLALLGLGGLMMLRRTRKA